MNSSKQVTDQGIIDRFNKALGFANLKQSDLIAKMGTADARHIVNKVATRGSTPRSVVFRAGLSRLLGVSNGWLWTGHGEMVSPIESTATRPESVADKKPEPQPVGRNDIIASMQPASPPLDPHGYIVIVQKADQEPFVSAGDNLYVTPSYPARTGDKVYVQFEDGHAGVYTLADRTPQVVSLVNPSGRIVTEQAKAIRAIDKVHSIIYG